MVRFVKTPEEWGGFRTSNWIDTPRGPSSKPRQKAKKRQRAKETAARKISRANANNS